MFGGGHRGRGHRHKAQASIDSHELFAELTSPEPRSIGNYMLGETLGDGTYGKVKVAYHRLIGAKVAMKMVDKSHASNLVREVEHWRRLNHPRIARLHELIVTETKIYLAMELAGRGELLDWLTREGKAPEALARHWFRQTLSAVSYLHHRNLVHRDLKLENILLDDQLNVKLVDFGFAREWDSLRMLHTYCGSVAYAAPEMISGKAYKGPEVDVWSLGVILYTLLCGSLPFDDDEAAELQNLIIHGKYDMPDHLGHAVSNLIDRCLRVKPKERLDVDAMDAHPWLASTEANLLAESHAVASALGYNYRSLPGSPTSPLPPITGSPPGSPTTSRAPSQAGIPGLSSPSPASPTSSRALGVPGVDVPSLSSSSSSLTTREPLMGRGSTLAQSIPSHLRPPTPRSSTGSLGKGVDEDGIDGGRRSSPTPAAPDPLKLLAQAGFDTDAMIRSVRRDACDPLSGLYHLMNLKLQREARQAREAQSYPYPTFPTEPTSGKMDGEDGSMVPPSPALVHNTEETLDPRADEEPGKAEQGSKKGKKEQSGSKGSMFRRGGTTFRKRRKEGESKGKGDGGEEEEKEGGEPRRSASPSSMLKALFSGVNSAPSSPSSSSSSSSSSTTDQEDRRGSLGSIRRGPRESAKGNRSKRPRSPLSGGIKRRDPRETQGQEEAERREGRRSDPEEKNVTSKVGGIMLNAGLSRSMPDVNGTEDPCEGEHDMGHGVGTLSRDPSSSDGALSSPDSSGGKVKTSGKSETSGKKKSGTSGSSHRLSTFWPFRPGGSSKSSHYTTKSSSGGKDSPKPEWSDDPTDSKEEDGGGIKDPTSPPSFPSLPTYHHPNAQVNTAWRGEQVSQVPESMITPPAARIIVSPPPCSIHASESQKEEKKGDEVKEEEEDEVEMIRVAPTKIKAVPMTHGSRSQSLGKIPLPPHLTMPPTSLSPRPTSPTQSSFSISRPNSVTPPFRMSLSHPGDEGGHGTPPLGPTPMLLGGRRGSAQSGGSGGGGGGPPSAFMTKYGHVGGSQPMTASRSMTDVGNSSSMSSVATSTSSTSMALRTAMEGSGLGHSSTGGGGTGFSSMTMSDSQLTPRPTSLGQMIEEEEEE